MDSANDPRIMQSENQICLIMVGLPARGKSLIAGKGPSRLHRVSQCAPLTTPCSETISWLDIYPSGGL